MRQRVEDDQRLVRLASHPGGNSLEGRGLSPRGELARLADHLASFLEFGLVAPHPFEIRRNELDGVGMLMPRKQAVIGLVKVRPRVAASGDGLGDRGELLGRGDVLPRRRARASAQASLASWSGHGLLPSPANDLIWPGWACRTMSSKNMVIVCRWRGG